MNGHQQIHNPHSPFNGLWTHDRNGQPAPPGFAFNIAGQLVQLAFQPWQQVGPFPKPTIPWESLDNPDYVSLAQGESTIEIQPGVDPTVPLRYGKDPLGRAVPPLTHEHVALVPQAVYQNQEDPDAPTQDNGTLALTLVGARGAVARINYRRAKSLISYVEVPSPDEIFPLSINNPSQPSPLNVPPVQATVDVPPVGGCISVAQISFGHKGAQFQALYDVPPGQIIHVPFGGSFGQTDSMLAPKYYTPSTTVTPTNPNGFRVYLLFPAGPQLNASLWNTLTQTVLVDNGFVNANSVPYLGWFAEAVSFSNTVFSQPTRRFYGTSFCTAVQANPLGMPPIANADQVTVAPIAWFASQVTLVGEPGLVFAIQTNTTAAGPQYFGPFPANQAVQMPAGATQILVWAALNLTQPGYPRLEVPWELDYTLSF
jgi:hypothetical protein